MLDFPTKTGLLAALLVTAGCIVQDPSPDLGACSEPPEDRLAWEFGEIGIGTCVASPSDLRVRPDPANPDNHFLFVANANARANFSGSSVLSIDGASIAAAVADQLGDDPGPVELACSEVGMHELDSHALGMQEFVGRFDFDDQSGLGLVTNRHTGGFEGDLSDAVFVLDASNPRALAFHDAGPRQTGPFRWIRVGADPWSVRIDPASGRAWVLSVTPHTVAALDLVADPIAFVDLVGERAVGDAVFEDADASGSAPDFQLLGINDDRLEDEVVTVSFVGGITRLYYPGPDTASGTALFSADSGDGVAFVESAGGPVLRPVADWTAGGLGAAAVHIEDDGLSGLVTGFDADGVSTIGRISATSHALDWSIASAPELEPSSFDADGVQDPDFITDGDGDVRVFWSGGGGLGGAIGHARGGSLTSLTRDGDTTLTGGDDGVVLAPSADGWDSAAVHAPSVILRGDTGEFFMLYAGHADTLAADDEVPAELAIGLARSDDGVTWTRHDDGPFGDARVLAGDAGAWDELGVAAPSAFFADGRFQLWYQGFDGVTWRTGRATSIDGKSWTKDPRNPVHDGVTDELGLPRRAYALKASPGGYYHVDGTITGGVGDVAFEGQVYDSQFTPVLFQIIGGQALGRGDEGTLDEDGAGAPAPAGGDDVLYVARSGSFRRLAAATDLGAGLLRRGAVRLTGFAGGSLDGLDGDEPTASIQGVTAAPVPGGGPGEVLVAFHTDAGISVVAGTLEGDDPELTAVDPELVLGRGDPGSFDDDGVRSPHLVADPDGGWRMYYEGRVGDAGSLGLATSDDGVTWTRETDPVLTPGGAGAWDDAFVGQPTVVWDEAAGQWRLWYLGSDGSRFRIGYAWSDDGRAWTRYTEDDVSVPVFDGDGLAFAGDDALHPHVALLDDDEGFELWFEGRTDGVSRVGRLRSTDGVDWSPLTNPTTAGDTFTFTTTAGDDDPSSAIELGDDRHNPEFVDGVPVHGAGASEMILSPDGRLGLVANKRAGNLLVLDLYDDSTDDWTDANYGGIEAVLSIDQAHGMVGLRDLEFDSRGRLWALMAPMIQAGSPDENLRFGAEGLIRLNWDLVIAEERAEGEFITEDVVETFLPAARGQEEDQGYETEVSVGPSAMTLSADASRAYVVNFNDNSLYVYDLDAGARGAVVAIVDTLDENPWEVALTPDERWAYVANYYGVGEAPVQHSTIQVVDVDESSPTFGRVLTRLTNVPRSDCGR